MTSPNHIAGGFVFTGLFCSLFSVNIFASPLYIAVSIFSFLLPDIDHTKSLIGKLFYPIAKWLAVNYGHRTITHSLIFLLSTTLLILFLEKNFSNNYNLSLIVFFGVLSHLILDMVTISGIPLFYPFYKNPCVLPANPDLRIHTGDLKQEGVALFIFSLTTIFMQDLFANGFWVSLNNQFADFKHVHFDYKKNREPRFLRYSLLINNKIVNDSGYLFYASDNTLYIKNKGRIKEIDKNSLSEKIISLKMIKSNYRNKLFNLSFNNISEDSLNNILKNKFIISCEVLSSEKTSIDKLNFKSKHIITEKYGVIFKSNFKDSLEVIKQQKIKDIQLKIKEELNKIDLQKKEYNLLIKKLNDTKESLDSNLSNFELNEAKNTIIELDKKIGDFKFNESFLLPVYYQELDNTNNISRSIYYSGSLSSIILN